MKGGPNFLLFRLVVLNFGRVGGATGAACDGSALLECHIVVDDRL